MVITADDIHDSASQINPDLARSLSPNCLRQAFLTIVLDQLDKDSDGPVDARITLKALDDSWTCIRDAGIDLAEVSALATSVSLDLRPLNKGDA